MYNIRARPKDQSSDEDENDEQQKETTSSSIQSETQKDVDHQSVSNDVDVDVKRPDDEKNNISTVHSDKNDDDQKSGDFSMFKSKSTECGGNDKEEGVVFHCAALQRLGEALKSYAEMIRKLEAMNNGDDDELEPEVPTFSEFIGGEYRVQFIDDFNHFMAEHQYFAEEIKEEMIKRYGLRSCKATKCAFTARHFTGRRRKQKASRKKTDVRSAYYRQKFDSLHFHIFHLEESGYRYRAKTKSSGNANGDVGCKPEEDHSDDANDPELKVAVSTINESKKNLDFGHFEGGRFNKFTLNVSGTLAACLLNFREQLVTFNLCLKSQLKRGWIKWENT